MGAGDYMSSSRTHSTSADDLSWILAPPPPLGSSQPSLIIAAGYPGPLHSHAHPIYLIQSKINIKKVTWEKRNLEMTYEVLAGLWVCEAKLAEFLFYHCTFIALVKN